MVIFEQLKAFILLGFFAVIHSSVFSQEYIFGKVIDINGEPLPGVSIWMGKPKDYQASDINGEFFILKPTKSGLSMSISFVGYETVKIENIDTVYYPITITMEESPVLIGQPSRYYFGFVGSMQADVLDRSFTNFESVLGKENVDNLNKLAWCSSFECAVWYRKLYFAVNIGGYNYSVDINSVNAGKGGYKTFLLGTHFGYNIINSKGFLITPKIGLKWYKDRMSNYDNENRIPIEKYFAEKDLDIRFNHLVGFIGINFVYHPFGFYVGYAFKLNDKPWVYSCNNRLVTDHKIDFSNFNFGIGFSFTSD